MGRVSKVSENQKENLRLWFGFIAMITIIVIIAVAIAPYVISIVGIPLLMAGMTLIPAIFIGIVISLIYKAYCAIRNKK